VREGVKSDGFEYYEYVIVCVDDIICISEKPEVFMKKLEGVYKLKDGYRKPEQFLGMDLQQTNEGWRISTRRYLENIVKIWQGNPLWKKRRCDNAFPSQYKAESDKSAFLSNEFRKLRMIDDR
jgi:hypothetical protein